MDNPNYRSGFVAIVGRPNVGKSTLLNRVVGQKVAIMSDKPQTTRNKIQGIYTTDDAQIVFIDTPGVHKPKSELGDYMMKSALSSLNEVDAVIMMVNAEQLDLQELFAQVFAQVITLLSTAWKPLKSRFI